MLNAKILWGSAQMVSAAQLRLLTACLVYSPVIIAIKAIIIRTLLILFPYPFKRRVGICWQQKVAVVATKYTRSLVTGFCFLLSLFRLTAVFNLLHGLRFCQRFHRLQRRSRAQQQRQQKFKNSESSQEIHSIGLLVASVFWWKIEIYVCLFVSLFFINVVACVAKSFAPAMRSTVAKLMWLLLLFGAGRFKWCFRRKLLNIYEI